VLALTPRLQLDPPSAQRALDSLCPVNRPSDSVCPLIEGTLAIDLGKKPHGGVFQSPQDGGALTGACPKPFSSVPLRHPLAWSGLLDCFRARFLIGPPGSGGRPGPRAESPSFQPRFQALDRVGPNSPSRRPLLSPAKEAGSLLRLGIWEQLPDRLSAETAWLLTRSGSDGYRGRGSGWQDITRTCRGPRCLGGLTPTARRIGAGLAPGSPCARAGTLGGGTIDLALVAWGRQGRAAPNRPLPSLCRP